MWEGSALVVVFLLTLTMWSHGGDDGTGHKSDQPNQVQTEEVDDKPEVSETMVVTASRHEEPIADAPASMSVITEDRLSDSNMDSFADVLRSVPGMNAIQMSARQTCFTTRAATDCAANSQLVLLDGRSIYHDYTGWVLWDYVPVPLSEMKQIEVLRGPGSAMWGASALNGVINIRTKSPHEVKGSEIILGGGTNDAFNGSARWADERDALSYKISAAYVTQDAYDRPTVLPSGVTAEYGNQGTQQSKIDFRLDYEPDDEQLWSFSMGYGSSSGIVHTPIGPAEILDNDRMAFAQMAYTHGEFNASVFINHFSWDADNIFFNLPHSVDNTTVVAEISFRSFIGSKHALAYGGNFRHNGFDVSLAPEGDDRSEAGFFLEDQISISEHLQFNIGARLDWFDTIDTAISPRTSLLYRFLPNHSLRLSYGHAYRPPSFVENYIDISMMMAIELGPDFVYAFPVSTVGSRELDEEIINSFELAYTAKINRRTTLDAAVFYSRKKDTIDLYTQAIYGPDDLPPNWPGPPEQVPPLPKTFGFHNIGQVENRGIEISLHCNPIPEVDLSASYTWQDEPDVTGGDADFVVNVPSEHQVAASVRADMDRWFGTLGANYVDQAFWADVLDARFWGTTDSFTLVDLMIGCHLANDRYILSLKGTNLLDRRVQQHVFGDIIGRKLTAELRARF